MIVISDYLIEERKPSLRYALQQVANEAIGLVVDDEASFEKIASLYATAKDWEVELEKVRKKANEPDQARIKARNDAAKEILEPLKDIQQIARKKADAYRFFLEEQRQKAADIIGAEIVAEEIGTSDTTMFTRTVRRFNVIDLQKVPLEYLQINEKAVDEAIKAGIFEIPGLEIYETKITQLRRK